MKITAEWKRKAVRALEITRNRYKRPDLYKFLYDSAWHCKMCLLWGDKDCVGCPYVMVYFKKRSHGFIPCRRVGPPIPCNDEDMSFPVRKARMDFIDETIALVQALPEDE